MDKVKTKATKRQIVYNLSESERTEFASIGIFELIVVNFYIILDISIIDDCRQFFNCFKTKNNNGHPGGSFTG